MLFVVLWWSPNYWKYFQAVFRIDTRAVAAGKNNEENIVDRNTYLLLKPDLGIPMNEWSKSNLNTLKNISLPNATNEGIDRMRNLKVFKVKANARILNMTELTFLAKEVPFSLEKGSYYPLWFHLGVGMFNKQAEFFENRISKQYYDAVFFENIPNLNNFYPFRVRDKLKKYYVLTDSFPAPRRGETQGVVEIYLRTRE